MPKIKCLHCGASNQDVTEKDPCWKCGGSLSAGAAQTENVTTEPKLETIVFTADPTPSVSDAGDGQDAINSTPRQPEPIKKQQQTASPPTANAPAPLQYQRQKSSQTPLIAIVLLVILIVIAIAAYLMLKH